MPVLAYKITINPKSHESNVRILPQEQMPPSPVQVITCIRSCMVIKIYIQIEKITTQSHVQGQLSRLLTSVYVVFSKLLPARALTKCRQ